MTRTIEAIDGYYRIWKAGKILRLTCTLQEAELLRKGLILRTCRGDGNFATPSTGAPGSPGIVPATDVQIFTTVGANTPSNAWLPQPDGIRHRNSEREYLVTHDRSGSRGLNLGPGNSQVL